MKTLVGGSERRSADPCLGLCSQLLFAPQVLVGLRYAGVDR